MDITVTVTRSLGLDLIEMAGFTRDERGRWVVPEEARELTNGHAWTWATDEALMWALVIIASGD